MNYCPIFLRYHLNNMETNSLKLIGKLILNNTEIVLTTTYTILGRTSDVILSNDCKGKSSL